MDPPPEPAARNTPRFPMLDISDGGDNESTFGALSEDLSPHGDRGVQLGFGFASSRDHRISRGAQDMGTISRSASFSGLEPSGESAEDSASLVSPGLGHENPDDGAVSPISAYNDDDGFRGYPPGNSRR
ncbi:hypothetical protein N7468_007701 [Penicillium chermesinum]|uniref:Uncharacterized protein n=1 Tax=Penicillium chermesinum TaxID=63820 RepID=A0A9W9TKT3_9EURO|nr:uncharacterized protein N7468_007701 [Penicillium chermesinum]KAJ5226476.1 hypothetical protein N7468_007701 [Penicillium chermesinum]